MLFLLGLRIKNGLKSVLLQIINLNIQWKGGNALSWSIIINMNVSDAAAKRILDLCNYYGITVNKLCTLLGVTPSTVNDIVNRKTKNVGIITIKKLCDGLSITIPEFFNTTYFFELEQELY